ncbi:MAG: type VI secretion system tip protein TssI/VgrG [Myxococcota bacterium]
MADDVPEDSGDVRCTFECGASSFEWTVVHASITEELNEPYHLSLSLRTEETDADPTDMLGEPCSVTIERGDLTTQYPAIVHWIEDAATGDRFTNVSIEASAGFWMLSQGKRTRIFQDMTVPEILDEVLGDGLGNYDRSHNTDDLARDYPKCEYRVQYDESDFAFCERLMEEEGIIYRFDREDSAEVMLLVDDPKSGPDVESTEGKDIHFSSQQGARESVGRFVRYSAMRPTKLAMRNFDWTSPSLPIDEAREGGSGGDGVDGSAIGPDREVYDHDLAPPTLCDYSDSDGYASNDASDQCDIRRELSARDKLVLHGDSTVIGFQAGGAFSLVDHNLEGDYRLTRVSHSLSSEGGAAIYDNHFVCIPADTPYRPERRTPKPRVAGIETATVVGPSGQEIHTDKHGRIKVQFHWDRDGQKDDHSSCFIRVVQPWAGAGWGFVFLPRIGMEVTVAFIQGDADRPIITGSVYNGENLTSYEMPNEMTKSTIRTQTSPGGGGYNELSFEDKAGSEEIFLQAQKDLRETIKNNHAKSVGNDHDVSVGSNQSLSVGANQTIDVSADKSETVGGNKSTDVTANLNETVGSNMETTVNSNKKLTVMIGSDEIVGGKKKVLVGGLMSEQVGASRSCTVVGAWSTTAGLSAKLQSAKNVSIKARKNLDSVADENMTIESGKDMSLAVKEELAVAVEKKGVIEVKEELTIKVGQAEIKMKKNGDITIKGKKINVKGSGDVVIKGSKIALN